MARMIQQHLYPALPTAHTIDLGQVLFLLLQFAVVGGIVLFLVLAIVNTILGTPAPEPAYSPYG